MKQRTIYLLLLLLAACLPAAEAQNLSKKYNTKRPVVVVCDWDKAPYEFLNVNGAPAGINIDLLQEIMDELDLPVTFVMKDWPHAIKTFERGDADLILASSNQFDDSIYTASKQVIHYARVKVAMTTDTSKAISLKTLNQEGVVLKQSAFASSLFKHGSITPDRIEYQSTKVALQGLLNGDNKYFLWIEEPLRWKLKELNLNDIYLNDVNFPMNEVRIIGRDKDLIYNIDDRFSRLKQRGKVEDIRNKWLHPERVKRRIPPFVIYIGIAGILIILLLMLFSKLARGIIREAMRKSNELNKMIYRTLDISDFSVVVYDIRHDRFTNQYGSMLPVDGLSLKEVVAHIHPGQQKEFQQKIRLLADGEERKFDVATHWNAGTEASPHWVAVHCHAMSELDNLGRPTHIVSALHDMSRDNHDDQMEREVVCKYNAITNAPGLAISVHNRDGKLISVNNAIKELYGFITAGKSIDSEHLWHSMNLLDISIFRDTFTPASREALQMCRRITDKENGIEHYVETHITPVVDQKGDIINFLSCSVDMSDEQQLDATVHRQRRKYEQTKDEIERLRQHLMFLLSNTKRLLWRSDLGSQTICFYRQLGEPEAQMDFATYLNDIAEEDRERAMSMLRTDGPLPADGDGGIIHFSKTILGPEESWYKIVGQPIYDKARQLAGHRGICIDVTRLVNARRRHEEMKRLADDSVRMKSGFMASMTHELRTPLNAIVGFTSVLSALGDSPERAEYVKIIRNSSDMLQRLINDIIEASSLTEGRLSIVPQEVDFAEAFDDICITLEQRVKQREDVEFLKDNPYEHFLTRIDIGRVQQLLTNFVTNAVKFTEKGYIRLGYRYAGGLLRLYCDDTGKGIARDKQETVFQRFVKLDEFSQGTGMGLTICKTITQQMGGSIGVNSEGEGHGSTFWADIPCEQL